MTKRLLRRSTLNLLRRLGVAVSPFSSSPTGRLSLLLNAYGIETVLDVGANIGQYAKMLRLELDYRGFIYSYEPMPTEYQELQRTARGDPHWRVFNYGLGDTDEATTINIAGNSTSSSLLRPSDRLLAVAPQATYIGTQPVYIHKLDTVFTDLNLEGRRLYLKVDAQGFESKVLTGAEHSLPHIGTVQLEMALVPMYADTMLIDDYLPLMRAKGYNLVHVMPGLWDRTSGEQLEVDGIFHRPE